MRRHTQWWLVGWLVACCQEIPRATCLLVCGETRHEVAATLQGTLLRTPGKLGAVSQWRHRRACNTPAREAVSVRTLRTNKRQRQQLTHWAAVTSDDIREGTASTRAG